jgi:hypothetical protein
LPRGPLNLEIVCISLDTTQRRIDTVCYSLVKT